MKLKQLQSRLAKCKDKEKELLKDLNQARLVYEEHARKRKSVEDQIKQMTSNPKKPIVSEHAILRYLERVQGVDINAIGEEILTKAIPIPLHGKLTKKVGDYSIVSRDNVIVTVV